MSKEVNSFRNDLVSMMPTLRSFANRFVHAQADVADLVQETLVKALANEHRFQHGTNLNAWLFTIMRNTYVTNCIRKNREQPLNKNDTTLEPASVPASQVWSLRATELQRALERLPRNYREVINLVILEGLTYEAAAMRLGCPVGTIKSRMSRARNRLAVRISWTLHADSFKARPESYPARLPIKAAEPL